MIVVVMIRLLCFCPAGKLWSSKSYEGRVETSLSVDDFMHKRSGLDIEG